MVYALNTVFYPCIYRLYKQKEKPRLLKIEESKLSKLAFYGSMKS